MNSNRTLLHILLVITFIFAGLSTVVYLMMGAMLPMVQNYYAANPSVLPEQFGAAMERMLEVPRTYYIGCALLYALEVLGAAFMWTLRPAGFHCYTLARLLLIIVPLLFLGRGFVGIGDVMFAILFIFIYWSLLRQLGAFSKKEEDENNQ
jgi:hypothetical protein